MPGAFGVYRPALPTRRLTSGATSMSGRDDVRRAMAGDHDAFAALAGASADRLYAWPG